MDLAEILVLYIIFLVGSNGTSPDIGTWRCVKNIFMDRLGWAAVLRPWLEYLKVTAKSFLPSNIVSSHGACFPWCRQAQRHKNGQMALQAKRQACGCWAQQGQLAMAHQTDTRQHCFAVKAQAWAMGVAGPQLAPTANWRIAMPFAKERI
ncbi:hypothetical protein OH492_20960 [Vibrio chagasii]|nr:hypothetical protein [Vibrio chagasii]